jgi:hypothetical protein
MKIIKFTPINDVTTILLFIEKEVQSLPEESKTTTEYVHFNHTCKECWAENPFYLTVQTSDK